MDFDLQRALEKFLNALTKLVETDPDVRTPMSEASPAPSPGEPEGVACNPPITAHGICLHCGFQHPPRSGDEGREPYRLHATTRCRKCGDKVTVEINTISTKDDPHKYAPEM